MSNKHWNKYDVSNKKEKPKFRVIYIAIIVLCTFIICFGLYMLNADKVNNKDSISTDSSSANSKDSKTTAEVTTTALTTTESVLANPLSENVGVDATYFDSCAFLGDSITTGLSGYGFVPEKNVLAGTGMNIEKIEKSTVSTAQGDITILDALKTANPQNIYIMLGTNGIAWLTNEKMIEEYSKFVDKIKEELPSSNIYILSIPPVTVNKETAAKGSIQNSAIDSYNSALLQMANDKKIYFVDINTALKGNDGKLPVESAEKDGMHFKKDTYKIVIDYILKHTAKE